MNKTIYVLPLIFKLANLYRFCSHTHLSLSRCNAYRALVGWTGHFLRCVHEHIQKSSGSSSSINIELVLGCEKQPHLRYGTHVYGFPHKNVR